MKRKILIGIVFLSGFYFANFTKAQPFIENDSKFSKTNIKLLKENPASLFDDNWFVLTAGNSIRYNPMTISWGSLGWLWKYPTATVYVRDSRYTYKMLNEGKYFTLCAFDEQYRDKVKYIGTKSGRDIDKIKETGLTPLKTKLGNIVYREARLIIECEKIYASDILPTDITDSIGASYYQNTNSRHKMYIGKILSVWETTK